MTHTPHTPIPWRSLLMGSEGCRLYPDYGDIRERGKFIASVTGRDVLTDQANADLIIKAVNSYAAMKAAIEGLLAYYDRNNAMTIQMEKVCDHIHNLRRALANGEEPTP